MFYTMKVLFLISGFYGALAISPALSMEEGNRDNANREMITQDDQEPTFSQEGSQPYKNPTSEYHSKPIVNNFQKTRDFWRRHENQHHQNAEDVSDNEWQKIMEEGTNSYQSGQIGLEDARKRLRGLKAMKGNRKIRLHQPQPEDSSQEYSKDDQSSFEKARNFWRKKEGRLGVHQHNKTSREMDDVIEEGTNNYESRQIGLDEIRRKMNRLKSMKRNRNLKEEMATPSDLEIME